MKEVKLNINDEQAQAIKDGKLKVALIPADAIEETEGGLPYIGPISREYEFDAAAVANKTRAALSEKPLKADVARFKEMEEVSATGTDLAERNLSLGLSGRIKIRGVSSIGGEHYNLFIFDGVAK